MSEKGWYMIANSGEKIISVKFWISDEAVNDILAEELPCSVC
jgi:hypothetical protein